MAGQLFSCDPEFRGRCEQASLPGQGGIIVDALMALTADRKPLAVIAKKLVAAPKNMMDVRGGAEFADLAKGMIYEVSSPDNGVGPILLLALLRNWLESRFALQRLTSSGERLFSL